MFTDIANLKKWLDTTMAVNNSDIFDSLAKIMGVIGKPEQISSLLNSILHKTAYIQEIAEQSYLHRNGFDKIVLLSSINPQYSLRLHIWWPDQQKNSWENIHSHPWDFCTTLLTGSYRFQEFKVVDFGTKFYEYAYNPKKEKTFYTLEYNGEQPLKCVFDCIMQARTSYAINHEKLHRVISNREMITSTLVLQGPDIHYPSRVFFEKEFIATENGKTTNVGVMNFSMAELTEKFNKYLNCL